MPPSSSIQIPCRIIFTKVPEIFWMQMFWWQIYVLVSIMVNNSHLLGSRDCFLGAREFFLGPESVSQIALSPLQIDWLDFQGNMIPCLRSAWARRAQEGPGYLEELREERVEQGGAGHLSALTRNRQIDPYTDNDNGTIHAWNEISKVTEQ